MIIRYFASFPHNLFCAMQFTYRRTEQRPRVGWTRLSNWPQQFRGLQIRLWDEIEAAENEVRSVAPIHTHRHRHTHAQTHTHTHRRARTHTHRRARTHTHTDARAHTHTHARARGIYVSWQCGRVLHLVQPDFVLKNSPISFALSTCLSSRWKSRWTLNEISWNLVFVTESLSTPHLFFLCASYMDVTHSLNIFIIEPIIESSLQ